MMLRVGPDVYPEVKIISTVQPNMICFVFLLKQQHIMTSQDAERRMFLTTLLTPSAALLLIPFSFILQTGITQKNFGKPLFCKVVHESEMKAFSSKSLHLISWDVAG